MNLKMMLVTVVIFGLIAVPVVVAAPIQTYINQNANGDLLRTQDQDRLRARDCGCTCDCIIDQNQTRLRLHECSCNRACNGETEMEQNQHKYRNGRN